MNPQVSVPGSQLAEYCRANFGPESDIDLLVEFETDRKLGLFDFVRIEQGFADLFGRKVDLIERIAVERSRNYIRRAAILESTETIYAA